MDRRSFLKVSLHATGTAAVVGLPAGVAFAGDPPVELKPDARVLEVAVRSLADLPGAGASVARMARRLAAVTDGRLGLRAVEGGAGPLTTASSGGAEAAFGPLAEDAALSPTIALLAGMPGAGAMPAETFGAWYEAAGGQTLLDDAAAALGVRAMAAGASVGGGFLYARTDGPIRFTGRRIAAVGIAADVLQQLGAEPVSLSVADLAPALAEGRVDVVEAPALTALAIGLPGIARGVCAHRFASGRAGCGAGGRDGDLERAERRGSDRARTGRRRGSPRGAGGAGGARGGTRGRDRGGGDDRMRVRTGRSGGFRGRRRALGCRGRGARRRGAACAGEPRGDDARVESSLAKCSIFVLDRAGRLM
jgi:hypothetical protein